MPHTTSTQSPIRRVDASITAASETVEILRANGAVILQSFVPQNVIAKINKDLEEPLEKLSAGSSHSSEHIRKFHGAQTKRLTNMVVRSPTFRDELFDHDYIHEVCGRVFHHETGSYWVASTQVIEIGPGNAAQPLHRDVNQYQVFRTLANDGPEGVVNFLVALTDCTEENGATRVVPGSSKWADWSVQATQEETIPAELKAGDVLVINGRILHGGGANRTQSLRRVIAWSFIPSFLTPEEAYAFLVPMETARKLSPRGQRMIGFRSQYPLNSPGLWQSDYSELADVLGLQGYDVEIERVKAAGVR